MRTVGEPEEIRVPREDEQPALVPAEDPAVAPAPEREAEPVPG